MRRDYFICTFLLCICVSLFYVCFSPLYFVYGNIVVREFSTVETIFAWIYLLLVFGVLPVFSAVFKKFWITAGLATYSLLCGCIPVWVLPKMVSGIAGEKANILSVIWGYCLKAVYGMVEAPFAPITRAFGDKFTETLPRKILPEILIIYCGVQIFRFYRDAYIAEKLTPAKAIDTTAKENKPQKNDGVRSSSVEPDILGTVISAPTTPKPAPVNTPKPAPVPAPPVKKVNPQPKPVAANVPIKVIPNNPPKPQPTVVNLPGNGGVMIVDDGKSDSKGNP